MSEDKQNTKETAQKELEKLNKQLDELKGRKRELEQKYTPDGLYKAVAGRKNILREIKESEMVDSEKFDAMKTVLKNYLESL